MRRSGDHREMGPLLTTHSPPPPLRAYLTISHFIYHLASDVESRCDQRDCTSVQEEEAHLVKDGP